MTTTRDLQRYKVEGRRFAMLTAYDYTTARLLDEAGIAVLLVGDSAAMTVLGHSTTLPVTMEEMLMLSRAVARGSQNALLVGDMPFGSYHAAEDEAVANAARFLKEGGMHAVKLEGGAGVVGLVNRLSTAGIPVMGHVGLTPQSVHAMGGFKVQGKGADDADRIFNECRGLERAGAFAVVLEGIPGSLAAQVTTALAIPTIGIGAGPSCDGQVLVVQDMLGLTTGKAPKFVKRFTNLAEQVLEAATRYREEVETGVFPGPEHTYSAAPDKQALHAADEVRYGGATG